jgi:hypothetical protein
LISFNKVVEYLVVCSDFGTPAIGLKKPLLALTKVHWSWHYTGKSNVIVKQFMVRVASIKSVYGVFHLRYLRPNMVASLGSLKKNFNAHVFSSVYASLSKYHLPRLAGPKYRATDLKY